LDLFNLVARKELGMLSDLSDGAITRCNVPLDDFLEVLVVLVADFEF